MRATEKGTEEYHRRHPGLHTAILGRTGLRVSGAGFGGYRISAGVDAHHMALRKALSSGINLIDTSANYADGASEELIGTTITEMVRSGAITRGEIVLVSKGGYIQGNNYTIASERAESGSEFPEVVEYGQGLWHCIAPEFLEDQITRSLGRLGLDTIDIYLLHNPEYYLSWAAREGMPLQEARNEYHRRIRNAFIYLESEVERGRIAWYGISSNSFPHPAGEPDHTSLEECLKIAERISLVHHFAAIQFPANLMEPGFVTERNQSGERTLIDLAREKNLGVLINRPLNGIVGGELVRLADFPSASIPFNEEHITQGIGKLTAMEEEFDRRIAEFAQEPSEQMALRQFVSVGETIGEHWRSFGSIEHYNDILSQHFAPRLGYVAHYLREHGTQAHVDWFNSYMADARALLQAVGGYYGRAAQERSDRIRERLCAALECKEVPGGLSAIAIRMLLGVEGVDTVLVGMRRDEYVEDVLGALRAGPLGGEETWRKLGFEEGGKG